MPREWFLVPPDAIDDVSEKTRKGTVVKRVISPPIGALTICFITVHRGQKSALNNTQSRGRQTPSWRLDCEYPGAAPRGNSGTSSPNSTG